jgi:hypothetical protein
LSGPLFGEVDMSLLLQLFALFSENGITWDKTNDKEVHVVSGHILRAYSPIAPIGDNLAILMDFDFASVVSTHGNGVLDVDSVRRTGGNFIGLGSGLVWGTEFSGGMYQVAGGYTWMYNSNAKDGSLTGGHALTSALDVLFHDGGEDPSAWRVRLGYDLRMFKPVSNDGAPQSNLVHDVQLRLSYLLPVGALF